MTAHPSRDRPPVIIAYCGCNRSATSPMLRCKWWPTLALLVLLLRFGIVRSNSWFDVVVSESIGLSIALDSPMGDEGTSGTWFKLCALWKEPLDNASETLSMFNEASVSPWCDCIWWRCKNACSEDAPDEDSVVAIGQTFSVDASLWWSRPNVSYSK